MKKNKAKRAVTKPQSPTEEQMRKLAQATGLTFDGGDDNRLFAETVFTFSSNMSESEYEAMEKDLADFSIEGTGFSIEVWNDCSGYHYWTIKQEEDNYIQVTAYIQDVSKVVPSELKQAMENAFEHFHGLYSRS